MKLEFNKNFDLTDRNSLSIAIISDTHTFLDENIENVISQCDIAIHAGDIGCLDVIEKLKPKSGFAYGVAGNNDKPFLWDMSGWEFLKELPDSIKISLPGGTLAVEHGHVHDMHKPSHEDLRNAHEGCRAVIYGHTHHQIIDDSDQSCMVLNPGAAGNVRTHGGPSCLKLSITNDKWDVEAFRFSN